MDKAHNTLKYSRKFHFGGGGNALFGSQTYTPLKALFDAFNIADSQTIHLTKIKFAPVIQVHEHVN